MCVQNHPLKTSIYKVLSDFGDWAFNLCHINQESINTLVTKPWEGVDTLFISAFSHSHWSRISLELDDLHFDTNILEISTGK